MNNDTVLETKAASVIEEAFRMCGFELNIFSLNNLSCIFFCFLFIDKNIMDAQQDES